MPEFSPEATIAVIGAITGLIVAVTGIAKVALEWRKETKRKPSPQDEEKDNQNNNKEES